LPGPRLRSTPGVDSRLGCSHRRGNGSHAQESVHSILLGSVGAACRDPGRVVRRHVELIGDDRRIRCRDRAVQHIQGDRLQRPSARQEFTHVIIQPALLGTPRQGLLVDLGYQLRVGQPAVAAIELIGVAKRADRWRKRA